MLDKENIYLLNCIGLRIIYCEKICRGSKQK